MSTPQNNFAELPLVCQPSHLFYLPKFSGSTLSGTDEVVAIGPFLLSKNLAL